MMFFEGFCHNVDGLRRCQHTLPASEFRISYAHCKSGTEPGDRERRGCTGLDNIHANVADTRINQLPHKPRRSGMNVNHAHCILSCQRSSCRHCIAAMSRDDLLVCFQAPFIYQLVSICDIENRIDLRTATGIRPGNHQDSTLSHHEMLDAKKTIGSSSSEYW